MTAEVKDELSRLEVSRTCCRKAEVSALLRFASGLHLVAGHIVVEADVDAGATARRLRKDLAEIFNAESEIAIMQPSGLRKSPRYVVRVVHNGHSIHVICYAFWIFNTAFYPSSSGSGLRKQEILLKGLDESCQLSDGRRIRRILTST